MTEKAPVQFILPRLQRPAFLVPFCYHHHTYKPPYNDLTKDEANKVHHYLVALVGQQYAMRIWNEYLRIKPAPGFVLSGDLAVRACEWAEWAARLPHEKIAAHYFELGRQFAKDLHKQRRLEAADVDRAMALRQPCVFCRAGIGENCTTHEHYQLDHGVHRSRARTQREYENQRRRGDGFGLTKSEKKDAELDRPWRLRSRELEQDLIQRRQGFLRSQRSCEDELCHIQSEVRLFMLGEHLILEAYEHGLAEVYDQWCVGDWDDGLAEDALFDLLPSRDD